MVVNRPMAGESISVSVTFFIRISYPYTVRVRTIHQLPTHMVVPPNTDVDGQIPITDIPLSVHFLDSYSVVGVYSQKALYAFGPSSRCIHLTIFFKAYSVPQPHLILLATSPLRRDYHRCT